MVRSEAAGSRAGRPTFGCTQIHVDSAMKRRRRHTERLPDGRQSPVVAEDTPLFSTLPWSPTWKAYASSRVDPDSIIWI